MASRRPLPPARWMPLMPSSVYAASNRNFGIVDPPGARADGVKGPTVRDRRQLRRRLDDPLALPGATAPAISSHGHRKRLEMANLIATTQATVDGVVDPVGEWVQGDGDQGEYS